ncbi:MAG: hypothetical protein IKA03_05345 [Alphaproteobacteria bacterium]|nr:hypothetical protein [Alphaproteobacteria bacterium]
MFLRCLGLVMIGNIMLSFSVFAKIHWLPDYLGSNLDRLGGRSNQVPDYSHSKPVFTSCPDGYISDRGDKFCSESIMLPGFGYCYKGCSCSAELYPYNSSNCSGYFELAGTTCDDGTIHATECEDHTCDYREDNPPLVEEWGCEELWPDCLSKCKTPYQDNCHHRTDETTDWGCEKYWEDCESKCEIGKSCTPNDCSDFTFASIPPNASQYETCQKGCDDYAWHYKPTRCEVGYTLKDNRCQDLGAFVFSANAVSDSSTLKFRLSGRNYTIDWGDGTYEDVASSANATKSHTYTSAGDYTVAITGDLTYFANVAPVGSTDADGNAIEDGKVYLTGINKLNLPLVTQATIMGNCGKMTGSIPELPPALTNGYEMFYGCSNLDGTLPAELPDTLQNGQRMFLDCSKLTGNVPNLGESLTNGITMFYGCSNLSGSTPVMPSTLTSYADMFASTQVTNDGSWPDSAW